MAMTQAERDEKRRTKMKARGEEILRLPVRTGEKDMLRDLMAWTDDAEQASVIAGCLRYVHSLGPEGAYTALRQLCVLHELNITESWRARFDNESRRELMRDPGDEIIAPQ
jgi:hypothetical protein